MTALCKSFVRRSTQPFNRFDSPVCDRCFIFLKSKEFTFEVLVIETVIDKVDQIRADCLSAFCFQKFCQMIVCSRKEFDKDFSNDTNSRFLFIADRNQSNSCTISRHIFLNCPWLTLLPSRNEITLCSQILCLRLTIPGSSSYGRIRYTHFIRISPNTAP